MIKFLINGNANLAISNYYKKMIRDTERLTKFFYESSIGITGNNEIDENIRYKYDNSYRRNVRKFLKIANSRIIGNLYNKGSNLHKICIKLKP